MRISVALTTYNGERYLESQLESLVTQQRPPYELIVGDDGSTDRTLEILQRFAARAPFAVQVTKNAERLGWQRNFAAVALRCAGDYVAFCDQDDVWRADKLARAAEC